MAKKSTSKGKKKNVVKVDFTNVEPGGKVPEGDYPVIVKEVTAEESSNGNPYLRFVFSVAEGRHKGKQLYHNTSLQPQALFNLRNTLEALGMEVPQSAISLDLDNLVGLTAAVAVELETYQGKERSRVVEVFPLEDLEGDDEEEYEDYEYEDDEDEENPFKGHPESADDEEEESDEDEDYEDEDDEDEEYEEDEEGEEYEIYTKEELEEMDDDELLEVAEDFEVDPVYTGKGSKKKLSRVKTIKAILEAQDEEDEEEE